MNPVTKARSRVWAAPPEKLWSVPKFALVIATFGLLGLSPFASGTIGSAAAASLYYFTPLLQNNWVLVAAIFLAMVIGSIATDIVELKTGEHDPGIVVIDEALGQWIALISFWYTGDLVFVILAFSFFRLFDIIKPYPARIFERSSGGTAVMLDDAVAGIYANVAAHLAMWGYIAWIK